MPDSLRHLLSYLLAKSRRYRRMSVCRHYGPTFKQNYEAVRGRENWDLGQMREYRNAHFLDIVRHAFRNVPYYRDSYAQAGLTPQAIASLDDIAKLPCIDKDTVRADPGRFLADNSERFHPREYRTSGSTGRPLSIWIDEEAGCLAEAMLWRHFNWAGYEFHHKAAYIEVPFGFKEGRIDTSKLYTMDAAHKLLAINSGILGPQTLPRVCDLLAKFRPHTLHSYPNLLMMLAQYLKQHPEYSIRPHSIILRSEKLYPEHRRYMEEVFGCEIFEIYAQWEYVCFAADCSRHNLHHFFDLGVVEIVKDGKPCAPGEEGELVCTGLHNYSMPLIRYRIGDLGRIRNVDCPCGCRMPVIEITGCRGKDLIVTRNGYFNVMSGLPVQMQQIKPFQQIQFVQEDLDRLEVRIVKREDFTPDERERMKQTVSRYFLDQLAVSIRFVDEIPRTEAQKYKYVESKVSLKL